MKLSLCYAYFQNPGMLAEQYRIWSLYPPELKAEIEIVIVDAGGDKDPDRKGAIHVTIPEGLPPLRIFRILEHERWNQDVARNLAADRAAAPWLLLTDMDHAVPCETLGYILDRPLSKAIYTFQRVDAPHMQPKLKDGRPHPHPNSFLISKALYWKIGGYDERLVGYYGTDGVFVARCRRWGTFRQLPVPLVRYDRSVIPDASTTSLSRKGEENDRYRARYEAYRKSRDVKTLTRLWEQLL